MEDDERSARPRNVVNEKNAEIVREFIRKEPKSSCMSSENNFFINILMGIALKWVLL